MENNEINKKIEEILQKYGVATKMTLTTGSTTDPIPVWYTQDIAIDLVEELSTLYTEMVEWELRRFLIWNYFDGNETEYESSGFPKIIKQYLLERNKEY